MFPRAKSIQMGIRLGANCEGFSSKKRDLSEKKRRGVLSSSGGESTYDALFVSLRSILQYINNSHFNRV